MPSSIIKDTKKDLQSIGFGVLLLTALSQVSIPLEPVPVTLQTVAVMLLGLTYSPAVAVKAVLAYLGLGALGVPVFASFSSGAWILTGKTAGYLWGFAVAAGLMAYLKDRFELQSVWRHDLLLCLIGTLVIFVIGVSWLSLLIGPQAAITYGLVPFILPGLAKALLLVGARRALR